MANLLGLGSSSQTQAPIRYSGLNVSSSMMDLPVALFWGQRRLSTNAIWYNNFQKHPISAKGKGGGAKGSQQYDYTAAVALGLCEGPIDSIVNIWAAGSTTTTTTLSNLNMTLFSGTAVQTPWSYVTTNYPTQARSYAGTTYLGCPQMNLGESATIQDNSFECVRAAGFAYTHTTPGWINPTTLAQSTGIDVLLSDVIPDLLTNPQYGLGFAVGDIGSITQFAAYQRAQGLFFSPLLNTQEKATDVLDRWAQLSNSWIFWSGTQLQFVPLGDSAVTGNGATYAPDNAAAYDLGLADFIDATQPVKVSRVDPADCYNRTVMQITDRTIGYISNPLEFKDQTLVDQFGIRDSSSNQADEICDPLVGKIVVQLVGKRAAYLRNTYSFKTSYRYVRCLPGTVLTLTEPNIGLSKVRVRVRTIEEDEDGNLSFLAEEFPGTLGTYTGATITAGNVPTTPNQYISPGSVNTPAIIEPDSAFTGGIPRIIVAASGGVNWGGCFVNISFDGTSYEKIGTITAAAIQGLLTASLASHADPDTVNTLAVNCTESLGVPLPVTNADADALRTLSLVAAQPTLVSGAYVVPTNGEMLAFGNVATTGSYSANLTYLRRGSYGTAPSAHVSGDQFTLIDVLGQTGTSISYDLPPQYIGQPIYLKLTSFNSFGNSVEDISTVAEYKYTPTGLGYGPATGGMPNVPTGLASSPGVGQNIVTWNANVATDNVIQYTLYAAAGLSQPFSGATAIFTGQTLKFVHSNLGVSAPYTYFIVATNAVGNSGHSTGVNGTTSATGIGSVTSVAMTVPAEWTVSGSPITGAGTLTVTKNNQSANLLYAGPSSGAAAQPTFRSLVIADLSFAGAANGLATLDGGGKLTSSQIPSSLVGAVVYQGTWNANTNSPTLASGVGTKGWYYKVSVAGTTTIDGISSWNVGDTIIFDGTTWDKIDGITNEVITVFGRFGAVVAQTGDYSFSQISGSVAASQLPNPSASTLGGVQSGAAASHYFMTGISTSGVPQFAQPAAADISGLAASATTDTTNASNIGSGTLADARLPTTMSGHTMGGSTSFPSGVWSSGGFMGCGTASPGGWAGNSQAEFKNSGAQALSAYQTAASFAIISRIDNTSGIFAGWFVGGSNVASVTWNGSAVVYGTTSDETLKRWKQVAQRDYKEVIKAIWVGDFEWKSDGRVGFGFRAQQLHKHYPQAVAVGLRGKHKWQVDYGQTAALAMWGVKDLYTRADEQDRTISKLTKELEELKAAIRNMTHKGEFK